MFTYWYKIAAIIILVEKDILSCYSAFCACSLFPHPTIGTFSIALFGESSRGITCVDLPQHRGWGEYHRAAQRTKVTYNGTMDDATYEYVENMLEQYNVQN